MGNESFMSQVIKSIMDEFDTDKNKTLDFKEGKAMLARLFSDESIFKANKIALGGTTWKFIESDENKDKRLDAGEIKELCKKLCEEKITELQKEVNKYQKKRDQDDKRLEDLRIEHYL